MPETCGAEWEFVDVDDAFGLKFTCYLPADQPHDWHIASSDHPESYDDRGLPSLEGVDDWVMTWVGDNRGQAWRVS